MQELGYFLTDKQIAELAKNYGIGYANLKAIIEVETNGQGFYTINGTFDSRIPKVRLEDHKFHEYTNGKYDKSHKHLSSPNRRNIYNLGGAGEYNRFMEAYMLDGMAAVRATSWGLGQVMGDNWRSCEYKTITAFLLAAHQSEETQLDMMLRFMDNHPKNLIDLADAGEWAQFAKYYNGPSYKDNNYDTKLATAYQKYV